VFACIVFCIAQLCAISISNPHFLGFISGLSGLAYGFLFGVFPSIVAETFGIHGLSQNWGFMTLAPAISGNIFNLIYGAVFDSHSVVGPDGERYCPDGVDCYKNAYVITLAACGLGIVVTLSTIRHQYKQRLREEGKGAGED
jgi:MFS family permease